MAKNEMEAKGGLPVTVRLTEGLGVGAFECATAMMMPPTLPAPTRKRQTAAKASAGTVTLTNVCSRTRFGAGARLVIEAAQSTWAGTDKRRPNLNDVEGTRRGGTLRARTHCALKSTLQLESKASD